jgi:Rrf2 family transcriptional regulator, nitric oxide-sensitive transcriptional repressor
MRLLASTDFALRILMRLATEPADHPLSVEALSRELGGLSRHHLHKIVQDLAALGVVRTQRGAAGGVTLAKAPDEIRVGPLVRALEGDQPIVECFRADHGCCTLSAGCRLRGFLRDAREQFYGALDRQTVADCLPATPAQPVVAGA